MAARGSTLCQVLPCLLVLAVAPLAWGQELKTPMEPDRSLNQAGPLCIRTFYNITQRHYATDKDCAFLIQQSFAAVRKDMCPKDGTGAGSPVQRCLSQSSDTTKAWTDFVRTCPVLNVKRRQPGQADESTRYFSCFDDFVTPEDFEVYAQPAPAAGAPPGAAGGRSSAGLPHSTALATTLAAAATAAAAVML